MNNQKNSEMLEKLRKRVRVMSNSSDEEISDLIESCRKELEMAGVYGDESDPTYYQAIVLYCKANYGYGKIPDSICITAGCNEPVWRLPKERRWRKLTRSS